jgi:imidazolonepropionase-like amidohydrolase
VTDPLEALAAATSGNAKTLRLDSQTGELREGLAADLVVVAGNPLEPPDLFGEEDRFRLVEPVGRECKNTARQEPVQAV